MTQIEPNKYNIDFSDIIGQESAKRAAEVATAGGHNLLMIGPPGSGKTMIASRISTVLPDIDYNEAIQITEIYSIAGKLNENKHVMFNRPFRSPNHNATLVSMTGGGNNPKPGEFSLAHNGVLFLDELPEYKKEVIEALREPMEEHYIDINRFNINQRFPANFMLVAAMNPCPCGYYGSSSHKCNCSPYAINKYLRKVSGPIMDRIDIQIEVNQIEYSKIIKNNSENSQRIKERVEKARKIQKVRYDLEKFSTNGELPPNYIKKYCKIDENGAKLLKYAFEKLKLTMRGYNKILKIARTIADIDESKKISSNHIAEAIRYRSLDRKYEYITKIE